MGGSGASKSGPGPMLFAFIAVCAGLLGGLAAFFLADQLSSPSSGTLEPIPQAEVDDSPPADGSVAQVAELVLPTVVSLEVVTGPSQASGSGFIIRSDGYIMTNNHVVANALQGGEITVVFNDGSRARAELVGRSVSYDIAVVRVDRENLPTSALGNSDNAAVGDSAIAIGSPLGLSGTVTTGIVSALDRPVTAGGQDEASFISAIQTDAAINPGNSGGPLLNAQGEVIGINSAIASLASGFGEVGSIGLGFAIPVNQAKRISEEIIATGTSTTPVIGVQLDLRYVGPGGRVDEVVPGGPADDAGIESGDVIVAVDGEPVQDSTELVIAIRANAPGDIITVEVEGKGELDVTLDGSEDI